MVPIPRTKLTVDIVDIDDSRRMMSSKSVATYRQGGLNRQAHLLSFHPCAALVAVHRLHGILSSIVTSWELA